MYSAKRKKKKNMEQINLIKMNFTKGSVAHQVTLTSDIKSQKLIISRQITFAIKSTLKTWG